MVLVDSSVWLALALSGHEFHVTAKTWMKKRRRQEALFCRATQLSFLRLLTNDTIVKRCGGQAPSNIGAWSVYQSIRSDSRIGWAEEPADIDAVWQQFSQHPSASPKLWMDAYLSAFAIAGGFKFVTTDLGFRQFKGLDVEILLRP